jgi:site-specific recombinase XerC
LRLFTDCDLRVSELCDLKSDNIDLEEAILAVLSLLRRVDYDTIKLILGYEIDDVMRLYVQRACQLQSLRHMTLDEW